MPRGAGAQHESQTRQLGEAAVRVLAREGVPALTFRTVAAEAGVSPGRVQHYARTSKGLIALTFRHVQELTGERVRASLAALPAPSAVDVVTATLLALIPQDEQDRAMLQVAAAVELHALTDPTLREELRDGRTSLITFLAEQIGQSPFADRSTEPAEFQHAATTLLATAEGLSTLALTRAVDSAEARQLLTASIHATLQGPE